ncbi:MAG TPA: glycosyltransferase family 1 protein, partial [Candidatus Thermoplasmatota archaeon]|nr:glycosyltransferase family 1 protein [Candidatus Thermoplasmatota archaeon]
CGGAAELVEPRPEAIAQGLARLLDDAGARAALARKGDARARELSWGHCAERVLALYREAGA